MSTPLQATVDTAAVPTRVPTRQGRWTAAAFAIAGVLFALYPIIHPGTVVHGPLADAPTRLAAEAFASGSWILSHNLANIAFVVTTLGLFGLHLRLQETRARRLVRGALVLGATGIGMTLVFYGAETFGLHAIGQAALDRGDLGLLALADAVREGPGLAFIAIGLPLLAVGTILFAIAIWRSGLLPRWSGVPLAVGFVLYAPQYFAPHGVRIAHGILVMVGSLLLAWAVGMRGGRTAG